MARGDNVAEATAGAFFKNAPTSSAGWGLTEAIVGEAIGGADHGQQLSGTERLQRGANFVATAAALGVAKLQAGKGGTDDMNPEGGTAYRSMSEAEFEMANKGKWSDSTIAGTARAVPIEDLGTATKIDE